MSNIYHTEPPTQGKVLLKTTNGDIDIELWPKEAPLACRNFVQLCLEGYYDNCPIHRVIKDFMVQTGDPTGKGTGGTSIWGRPFKDEIHGRIKFNHRGQVAMANENRPNTNQSQFFITLGPCDWIDRKHTIFGKVTGNTIYNVARLGEVEVGPGDRPLEAVFILRTEVLWNPFDDLVPRASHLLQSEDTQVAQQTADKPAKPAPKGVRDARLLSFAEEGEEVFEGVASKKSGAAKDHREEKKQHSSSSAVEETVMTKAVTSLGLSEPAGETEFEERMLQSITEKRRQQEARLKGRAVRGTQSSGPHSSLAGDNEGASGDGEDDSPSLAVLAQRHQQDAAAALVRGRAEEYQQLRDELLRSRRAVKVLTGQEAVQMNKDVAKNDITSLVQQRRQKYAKRKNEFGAREAETLARLSAFQQKVQEEKVSEAAVEAAPVTEPVSYHGQVLEQDSDAEEEPTGDKAVREPAWHAGKLRFRKHIDDQYRLGNAGPADDYMVLDSRHATSRSGVR